MKCTSKFLTLVLRHKPEIADVSLDPQGWVQIDLLIRGVRKTGRDLKRSELDEIVSSCPKKRLTISDDGRRIRAAQGHSIQVDLGLDPQVPPDTLFHGTARQSLDSIFQEGLKSGGRTLVHLSHDEETATAVGRRHGKPVVLTVQSGEMHRDGLTFFRADNGVWLTQSVPSKYLGFS